MRYTTLVRDAGNAVRLAEVIQVLAKQGFADLLRRMGLYEGTPAKILRKLHLIDAPEGEPATAASRLREALAELGPTFVKVGQILSTRPDIVGVDLSRELENLQDHVPPVSFEKMKPAIEKALQADLAAMFAEFEEEPFAAASLSQVHKARLLTGEQVAVKVQRPGIRKVIESDMKLLRGIAGWVEQHVQEFAWMDPVALIDEFHRSLLRELNFNTEAQVIEQFHKNFEDNDAMFIPRVYLEQTCGTILTMDFVDGVRIDDLAAYPGRNSSPKTVADLGCDTVCVQIFEHHVFHADPHPGNIFLTRDNQIAFLDFGMVGALEKRDVYLLAEALRGVLEQDTHECIRAFLACTKTGEAEDPAALERDVSDFIRFEAEMIVSRGMVSKALERLITILHRHHLQLAARFSLLLKALITIESTAHKLDPDLDMVPVMQPYVENILSQRFSPSQLMEELRSDAVKVLRLGREMPGDVSQILRMFRRGTFKMQVTHEKLERLASSLDRSSNRLTFGIITGSLIVGSSLLVAQGRAGQSLGMAGYSIAGLLGIALLVSILRSRDL